MKIVAVYRITYSNNVSQIKNLVDHQRWKEVKEGIENKILPKDELKRLFGEEFFTTESPLGEGIETGKVILPEHQGGVHDVKFEKIK